MLERSMSRDWDGGSPTSMTMSSKPIFRVRTKITNTPCQLKERIFKTG